MAPELLDFPHEHDQRVDWWALGVLMFELMCLGFSRIYESTRVR